MEFLNDFFSLIDASKSLISSSVIPLVQSVTVLLMALVLLKISRK